RAEEGIRDRNVTGVQTCALPISPVRAAHERPLRRLAVLEQELGEARMAGLQGALVRGAHWRNFLVKYAEANRMHKKMLALSGLRSEERRGGRQCSGLGGQYA